MPDTGEKQASNLGKQKEAGRGTLPIPDKRYMGHITYDARDPDSNDDHSHLIDPDIKAKLAMTRQ
jgi:hypothetical protein